MGNEKIYNHKKTNEKNNREENEELMEQEKVIKLQLQISQTSGMMGLPIYKCPLKITCITFIDINTWTTFGVPYVEAGLDKIIHL